MLFGCFFNSHFVFVSGKHISFLNACAFGFAVIKLLVKYGADALSKNNAMRSPLDFAKQIEDTEMINILANKNLISKYQSKK